MSLCGTPECPGPVRADREGRMLHELLGQGRVLLQHVIVPPHCMYTVGLPKLVPGCPELVVVGAPPGSEFAKTAGHVLNGLVAAISAGGLDWKALHHDQVLSVEELKDVVNVPLLVQRVSGPNQRKLLFSCFLPAFGDLAAKEPDHAWALLWADAKHAFPECQVVPQLMGLGLLHPRDPRSLHHGPLLSEFLSSLASETAEVTQPEAGAKRPHSKKAKKKGKLRVRSAVRHSRTGR